MNPARVGRPLVIAHRGASAWRPEHTLAAYALAIEAGADLVEPDLVMSGDGVLIARHEPELGRSTDVADHACFAARRRRCRIDGQELEGWFCEDFSLAELRTLRAREPLPHLRSTAFDGCHALLTFDEIVEFVADESRRCGRSIGLIPEIKHSTHHHALGLDPEQAVLDAIERHAFLRSAPFGIQSFEVGNLERLRARTAELANVFLIQLIGADAEMPVDRAVSYADMLTPAGLAHVVKRADALGINVRRILPVDAQGNPGPASTDLIEAAHAAGLAVQVWTLRPENAYLPPAWRCGDEPAQRCEAGALRMAETVIRAGVDGFFTDDPGTGRRAMDALRRP